MKKQWQVTPSISLGIHVAARTFYAEKEAMAWAQKVVRENGGTAYVYELLATVSAEAVTEVAHA